MDKRSTKRVVISGPTGAIGLALINLCIKEEISVLAICHPGSKRISRIPKSKCVEIVECDLANLAQLKLDMKYDAFFHLAWEGSSGEGRNNASLQVSNISATLDATKLAYRLGCHTFIGAGSQAEYGRVEGLLRPSTPTNPESGYGIAKLCAGNMSRTLANQLDMNHIWVRILSVYGPYDSEHSMIMSTIKKLLNHEVPSFTKGEQIWDYLYSDDAANALLLLAIKGQPNKTYCLGSGIGRPLYEYIQIIKEVINPMAELAVGALPYGPNQVMHLVADISDLEADIGFTPKTEFKDGIKMIMASINNDMNR